MLCRIKGGKMFIHSKCHNSVFPVQQIEIKCGFTLTTQGLIMAGIGRISKISPKADIIISCPCCNVSVQPTDILATCFQCGELLPLNKLFVLEDEGGQYCESCKQYYYPNAKFVVAIDAIKKTVK
jgi:hypothetical protein